MKKALCITLFMIGLLSRYKAQDPIVMLHGGNLKAAGYYHGVNGLVDFYYPLLPGYFMI